MTQAPCVFKSLGGANGGLARYPAMTQPSDTSHDQAYNRDQDQKPGAPQRMAQEPAGAQGFRPLRQDRHRPSQRLGHRGQARAQPGRDRSDRRRQIA